MSEKLNPIDITPEDNGLSPEEREAHRAEVRPRGEETLEDARKAMEKEIAEIEARQAKRRELLNQSSEAAAEQKISPIALVEKFKHSKSFRARVTGAAAIALGVIGITAGVFAISHLNKDAGNVPPAPTPTVATEQVMIPIEDIEEDTEEDADALDAEESIETTDYSGETIHGVRYDYHEYADRDNKEAYNAYGYDYSDHYEDREKTTADILGMAEKEPEALASYAYNIFTDDEKAELGIKDLNMVQIDDKFDQDGGGDLQKKVLAKFDQILNDTEKTKFNFYLENDTEETNYVYFVDENEDGKFTPDELHLGYDTKKRNKAPQVDISRVFENADGTTKTIKMLDLNMQCGYQPNYEKAPVGVQKIDSTKPVDQIIRTGGGISQVIQGGGPTVTPTPDPKPTPKPTPTPTPTPTPEWGKSGDPHAGTNYGQTIVTNPAVPDVSNINSGNQGYVDDNQANPGAPSEYNGVSADTGFAASGIVAPGADAGGERLEGGQDQSDGQMAGENAYHDEASESAGESADSGGNDSQESAQESNDVGGDNNSNSEEESRVAEGNF